MEDFRPECVVGENQDGGLLIDERSQPIPDAYRRRIALVPPMPGVVAQFLAGAVRVTTSVDQRRFTLRKIRFFLGNHSVGIK